MNESKNELLFLALGGSGEIGMNVNLYCCNGKWLMVDMGISFSDPYYPGVELVLPDLEFIEKNADDLLGIILTHGHEDHIGALPYLAEELDVPLYATAFTASLIRHKLDENGIKSLDLHVVDEGGVVELDPFTVTYKPLAHSIAEGNGVLIETPHGNIFHTGDWKLDKEPLIGTPTTPDELTAIGDKDILALVCDSTNVFNDKESGSEGDVKRNLIDVTKDLKNRILVTTFASNAARLQTLGEVAKATNRTLCVAGRSLDRMLEIGKANGYFKDFPQTVDFHTAMQLPRSEVMIIATGGQGEPRAALARIASESHKISLDEGDHVIFSSKQIPGNELAIGRIQNALAEQNINMITEKQAHIHVSGHPGKPELAKMYDWIRPEILLPVHGEIRHMKEQARFGAQCGIEKQIVQKNGDLIRLAPNGPEHIGFERAGRLVLDGDILIDADGGTINERRKISMHGQISVALVVNKDGKAEKAAEIHCNGVPLDEDLDAFLEEANEDAIKAMRDWSSDIEKLRENVRLAVRRCAHRWTGKKPIVNVLIVEL